MSFWDDGDNDWTGDESDSWGSDDELLHDVNDIDELQDELEEHYYE